MALSSWACQPTAPDEVQVTIESVSQTLTFDSVSRLGPHHAIASIHRQERRDGAVSTESTESIELAWNSAESFHFQRWVDGALTIEAIVHEGQCASRNGRGPWRAEIDGEQARMDVYTSWNAWDEALSAFKNRMEFVDQGAAVVDGRPARRFKVSLRSEDKTSKRQKRSARMLPHHLEGELIIDQATAVRLRTEVTAVEKQGTVRRNTTLKITRSGIGSAQGIQAPQTQLGTAGELLKKMPKRPTTQ